MCTMVVNDNINNNKHFVIHVYFFLQTATTRNAPTELIVVNCRNSNIQILNDLLLLLVLFLFLSLTKIKFRSFIFRGLTNFIYANNKLDVFHLIKRQIKSVVARASSTMTITLVIIIWYFNVTAANDDGCRPLNFCSIFILSKCMQGLNFLRCEKKIEISF